METEMGNDIEQIERSTLPGILTNPEIQVWAQKALRGYKPAEILEQLNEAKASKGPLQEIIEYIN